MLTTTRTASTTRTSTTSPSSTSRSTAPPRARSRTSRSRPATARRRSSYRPGSTRSRRTSPGRTSARRPSRSASRSRRTATGPTGDNRVVATAGNPVTVNVPYFFDRTNGGETLVTVTNRVLRAQVKVCKVVDPGSLTAIGSNVWSYSVKPIGTDFINQPPNHDGHERHLHRPDHAEPGHQPVRGLADHRHERRPGHRSSRSRPSPARTPG